MPGKKHGPSIKNPDVYDALRSKGMSKEKAARISNAQVEDKKDKRDKRRKMRRITRK